MSDSGYGALCTSPSLAGGRVFRRLGTERLTRPAMKNAFFFYVDDWLSSSRIVLMDADEERGYLRLLLHSWKQPDCGLPADPATLAALAKIPLGKWKRIHGQKILACFFERDGRIYNERLLRERQYQEDYHKNRASAGRKGAEKRWGGDGNRDSSANGSATSSAIGSANSTAYGKRMAQPMANACKEAWQNDSNSKLETRNPNLEVLETVETDNKHTPKDCSSREAPLACIDDDLFRQFVGVALAAGKTLSEEQVGVTAREWVGLEPTDHAALLEDYNRKCRDGTWSDPRHTPAPLAYLKTRAWRAVGSGKRVLPEPPRPPGRRERAYQQAVEDFVKGENL